MVDLQTIWICLCVYGRRCTSVSLWPLRQGIHSALLAGIAHPQSTRRGATVRLQATTSKDVRLWGVWPHGLTTRATLPSPATTPSVQSCSRPLARQTTLQVHGRWIVAAVAGRKSAKLRCKCYKFGFIRFCIQQFC